MHRLGVAPPRIALWPRKSALKTKLSATCQSHQALRWRFSWQAAPLLLYADARMISSSQIVLLNAALFPRQHPVAKRILGDVYRPKRIATSHSHLKLAPIFDAPLSQSCGPAHQIDCANRRGRFGLVKLMLV